MDKFQSNYDALWSDAVEAFKEGKVNLDPHLLNKKDDHRRGLTLICRPDKDIIKTVSKYIDELRNQFPEQYYYHENELHITVMSLFTATVDWQPYFSKIDEYIDAINSIIDRCRTFTINFRGVTASPGGIMIQGVPVDNGLNDIRQNIRSVFNDKGWASQLDKRYTIENAHMTVARFRYQENWIEVLNALEKNRTKNWGSMVVDCIELVDNDWYMSREKVKIISRYTLE